MFVRAYATEIGRSVGRSVDWWSVERTQLPSQQDTMMHLRSAVRRVLVNTRVGFGGGSCVGRRSHSAVSHHPLPGLNNVYHSENPMLDEWRRRDLFVVLRDTHKPDDIVAVAGEIADDVLPAAEPLRAKDATLLISKFGKAGETERAKEVYARGRVEGTPTQEELLVKTALMHALTRDRRFEEARDVFAELEANVA